MEVEDVINEAVETVKKDTKSKKSKSNKNDNIIYTSFLETDDYILEQLLTTTHTTHSTLPTHTQFLIFNKKTASTDIKDNFIYEGREYCPIVDELLLNGGILLPSNIEEYGTTKKLTDRIANLLFEYFEVNSFFEKFLPYLGIFYWVYEKFPFVPYLHFVGLTGTGKTTAEEVFGSICYKPIDASGSITMSPIFRTASIWRGTLLLDEFEAEGEGYKEMLNFLKSGVGNKMLLRTEGDKNRQVRVYLIKSPKVFTSENPISNAGLQSRTIVIRMEKNKKRIPLYRLPDFLEEAEHIRNQLLLWRLRNLNKIDLKEIKFGFKELESFDRRVQQVITPIYYLSDDKTRKEITEFAKIQEEETQKERLDSIDGQIFQVISDKYPLVTIKDIWKEINGDIALRKISEKRIANIVRKVFGFEIKRLGDQNISTLVLDKKEDRIKELRDYFGIPIVPVGAVESVGSVVTGTSYDTSNSKNEKSDDNVNELWGDKPL